jgi:hypothetical protein
MMAKGEFGKLRVRHFLVPQNPLDSRGLLVAWWCTGTNVSKQPAALNSVEYTKSTCPVDCCCSGR